MAISRLPRFLAGIGNLDPSQPGGGLQPELADVARLARRLVQRAVTAARTQDAPVASLLRAHLGPQAAAMPVASCCWPAYEHVNVQLAVDAWLGGPGRTHELAGITGPILHHPPGLADLLAGGQARGVPAAGTGSVRTIALPAGPAGVTRSCVQWGLYLVTSNGQRLALLLRPGAPGGDAPPEVVLETVGARQPDIDAVLAEIRQLAVTRSVFRGQVIALGADVPGPGRGGPLTFLDRPAVLREEVILPPGLLSGIEAQVLGIARHARRLRASGQHLKRGILLHGPPGTGKTHTIRYLLGQLPGRTVVVVSGEALQAVREACAVARALQPSVVVVEDVDLIAEDRGAGQAEAHPLLFQLLNEMDGLAADADVTFLLTTNRVDLLEPALAERPGRVDHAARLPLPDAPARRRLLRLYRGSLDLDLADPEAVISRTDGVTASFMKELLRRAALRAAAEDAAADGRPLRVPDAHIGAALDELLDTRNQLARVLLGGNPATDHLVAGADAVIRNPAGLPRRPARRLPASREVPWPAAWAGQRRAPGARAAVQQAAVQ